jgi:SpoVK/Ycf46/Vps4 family AAA+-type ATPase
MAVVGLLNDDVDPLVSVMKVEKAPLESYADIGGLEAQIQEVKEAVELPLTHPELYEDIGISPPKGVIFYGPPGTGKTLLAKAVANETSATFLRIVGSELIQKYLGEGPKLVREMFRVADEHAPSIVFIDEIDAVGTKRCVSRRLAVSHSFLFQSLAFHSMLSFCSLLSTLFAVTTRPLAVNVKFNEPCWSCSTSLTALTLVATSRCVSFVRPNRS